MTPRYRHYTTLKNFKTPMPTAVIWNKTYNFALRTQGKMLEWLKRHVWKACDRPKRFQGSNPCLSAQCKAIRTLHFCAAFLRSAQRR